MGPNRGQRYRGRVLTWLVKQHSKGQMNLEWQRFAGKHINPASHGEQSLHRFLLAHGIVRDAYAYNTPPTPGTAERSFQVQPKAPTSPIKQQQEKAESDLLLDLVGHQNAADMVGSVNGHTADELFAEERCYVLHTYECTKSLILWGGRLWLHMG